ncbi:MAG: hypothetical protein NTV40_09285 [Solirubrobacterales bacterium]|nr:hypothetical protein [Solirubrobacterales bacterium]
MLAPMIAAIAVVISSVDALLAEPSYASPLEQLGEYAFCFLYSVVNADL